MSNKFKYVDRSGSYATSPINVDDNLVKSLKAHAAKTGQKMYFVASEAIREYLATHAKDK